MVEDNPKKLIEETSLLNVRNVYGLLVFLRDVYPIGYSLEGLRHQLSIEIFSGSQLREIEIGVG